MDADDLIPRAPEAPPADPEALRPRVSARADQLHRTRIRRLQVGAAALLVVLAAGTTMAVSAGEGDDAVRVATKPDAPTATSTTTAPEAADDTTTSTDAVERTTTSTAPEGTTSTTRAADPADDEPAPPSTIDIPTTTSPPTTTTTAPPSQTPCPVLPAADPGAGVDFAFDVSLRSDGWGGASGTVRITNTGSTPLTARSTSVQLLGIDAVGNVVMFDPQPVATAEGRLLAPGGSSPFTVAADDPCGGARTGPVTWVAVFRGTRGTTEVVTVSEPQTFGLGPTP